jgi:hypothetical protein
MAGAESTSTWQADWGEAGIEAERLLSQALADEAVQDALREHPPLRGKVRDQVRIALEADPRLRRALYHLRHSGQAEDSPRWLRSLETLSTARLAVLLVLTGVAVLLIAFVGKILDLSVLENLRPSEMLAATSTAAGALVFLRRPLNDYLRNIRRRRDAFRRLDEARRRDLIDEVFLPEVRATINRLRDPEFDRLLRPLDSGGLRDLFDPRYEIPVKATKDLFEALRSLKAGSVGIAGPRGVGKTTLIRAACEGRLKPGDVEDQDGNVELRGVAVSAPVRYRGEDFVRHLFAKLCLAEIAPSEDEEALERHRESRGEAMRLLGLLALALLAAPALTLYFLGYPIAGRAFLSGLAAAGLLTAIGIVMSALARVTRGRRRAMEEGPIAGQARDYLERLRYLETISEEASGEVGAKGFKVAGRLGVSRASQAWAFPEVIEHYRRFCALLAERGPFVVGLDELDKMASAEEARSFLNEMKSLFDQAGIYYLVSISEDALSDFERRGQPIRDVFDSVFSEVLHVDYLRREESDGLLRSRAIGIAPPWPAVFHCLSGGLPREAIRVARRAVRVAEELDSGQKADLATVISCLTAERTRAHEHAVEVIAQGKVRYDGTQPLLGWLRGAQPVWLSGELDGAYGRARSALLERIDSVAAIASAETEDPRTSDGDGLARVVMELAAGWHHSLTCLEFFADLDAERFADACQTPSGGPSLVELLARGHQDLSAAPSLSWRTVSEFRERVGLELLSYPLGTPATALS